MDEAWSDDALRALLVKAKRGDLMAFEGRERIARGGREAYALVFAGARSHRPVRRAWRHHRSASHHNAAGG